MQNWTGLNYKRGRGKIKKEQGAKKDEKGAVKNGAPQNGREQGKRGKMSQGATGASFDTYLYYLDLKFRDKLGYQVLQIRLFTFVNTDMPSSAVFLFVVALRLRKWVLQIGFSPIIAHSVSKPVSYDVVYLLW